MSLQDRRLAAVWFADMVGFSALASRREGESLRLVERFQAEAREATHRYGGRLVKFTGDGALAEFPSADAAVLSVHRLLRSFARAASDAGLDIGLRAGVHVGSVTVGSDGDLYGAGVNVAARLQGEAAPGEALLSEDVWRQLRQREEFRFVERGERELRGAGTMITYIAAASDDAETDWSHASDGAMVPTAVEPVFTLRTLGRVGLRSAGGREVEEILHQPKRLALLVYMTVAAPGTVQRRDSLLALFWPELPESRARNALNKSVHFLRTHLGADAIVSRGAAEIGVDPTIVNCDAVAFDAALEAGRPEEAVELYDGPFLEGFHVAEAEELGFWLDRQRDHFARRYEEALSSLASRATGRGDHASAAEWWRRLMQVDPSNARVVVGLMASLEAVGERGEALQRAEEHTELLREEFGAEPDPEVEAFADRLRRSPKPISHEVVTAVSHNLPAQPTPMIGRAAELDRVEELLTDPDVRLLTLSGPGGTGKTRLAIEAAGRILERFPDGVFFVGLGPLRDAALVGATIARTIGLKPGAPARIAESLRKELRERRSLLVLDGFEQVLPAADLVTDLLSGTEALRVLVTSRAVLSLRGEHVLPVPPLGIPEDVTRLSPDEALEYEAVMLFQERAHAVRSDFRVTAANVRAVADICARLDGLPLAIELAAARVNLLTPPTILSRLANRFDFLTRGPRDLPERQQTLRRTFDWSYDLLSSGQRRLFRHLSVFVGGCSLDAIRSVCYPSEEREGAILDDLAALVDNSLLRKVDTQEDEPRFEMLETIREYAWRLLVDGDEAPDLRRRHAHYYLALAERAEVELEGGRQAAWLDRIEREHNNVQAVLDWALEWGEVELAVRMGSALWWFWWVRGHFTEMRWRLDQALARRESLPPSLQANLLVASGALASIEGDHERALALFQEALAVERDGVGKREVTRGLRSMAFAISRGGDDGRAVELLEKSLVLSRELDSPLDVSAALRGLAKMRTHARDYEGAEALYEDALEIGRRHGDRQSIAWALAGLGEVARHRGDLSGAAARLEKGLAICRELESKPGMAYLLVALAHVARYQGRLDAAREMYAEAIRLLSELGNRRRIAIALLGIADLEVHAGRYDRALLLYGAVEPMIEPQGIRLAPADETEYERAFAAIRDELDEARIGQLLGEGRAMGLATTIELALTS